MRRTHADLLLLGCAAVWGFAFLFQKSAMAHIGPLLFIGARSLLAALVLVPWAWQERRRAAAPADPLLYRLCALGAAAFLAGAFLQQTGIKTASVTNTGFLTALYVVVTPFVAFVLTRRAIAPSVWGAVALSFAGTWLLGGGTLGGLGYGDALVAISAPFWALYVVVMGLVAPLRRPVLFTALLFLAVGVVATAGAVLWEPVNLEDLRAATVEILYVGVLSTALTYTVFTVAMRATSPTEAMILVSTETVFAAFGGWLVLDERLTPVSALGAAAILAAVLMVQLAAARR